MRAAYWQNYQPLFEVQRMSLVEGGAQPYKIRILTATTSQRNVPAFGITNHLETRSVTRVIVLLTFSSFASDALGQQLASAGYSGQGAPSSPDELQQLSHCIPTLLLPDSWRSDASGSGWHSSPLDEA